MFAVQEHDEQAVSERISWLEMAETLVFIHSIFKREDYGRLTKENHNSKHVI